MSLEDGAHHLPVTLRMKGAACHRSGAADNRVEATADFFQSGLATYNQVSRSLASPAALGGRAGGPRSQRLPCTERRRVPRNSSHHLLQNTSKSNISPPPSWITTTTCSTWRGAQNCIKAMDWTHVCAGYIHAHTHTHTNTFSPSFPFFKENWLWKPGLRL